ncbi:S66 peptidase family protein [Bdellovibrio svalbardensis]|uniref:LD-carboxypeptidase n=1 Tax=Bdellovibrio svalbardensis TaxID=2972972 RepID=A0ABT6DIK2_9BACT|nr:LD-carboxypeptidase [Bdellovibrio svalbardensis]MDG0816657.1 LD-carboxypeptidase [Bdellovibrio svalbardensis]
MEHWKFLQENDIVDVVAPGYPSQPHEIDGAHDFLVKWKLVPRIPKGLVKPHFLHANEDEQRFSFLKAAIESKDSRTIWCLRGGYGSNRLLPMLAKLKKPKEPKLLIGISDITSIHTFLIQEWGWPTLHAPLLDRLGRKLVSPKHEKELHRILFGQEKAVEFKKLKPLNDSAKKIKSLKSKIVGGNLTVLQSSMGTPWQINADKSLLFIEDLGERGYRIDRMLEQFRQGGVLKKCQGIILGDFIGGEEPSTGKNNFDLVFKRWAQDLDIPLFKGLEAGHASVQRPVPFNTSCVLQLEGGKAHLTIQTGGKA